MNETLDKLAEALSVAQGAFENPIKDATARIPGKDGRSGYSYSYSTLDSLQNATRKVLSANGLSVAQTVQPDGSGGFHLDTMLLHLSGQSLVSRFPLSAFRNSPQAFGSELTYMRRYAYAALLNIASEEDDDATAAQHAPAVQAPPTGRQYTVGTPQQPFARPQPDTGEESGKAVGVVGKINPSPDGKCWFLSIGALGTAKGESVWCRDKELIDSLQVGMEIIASVRSKKPGSYQLVSFIPADDDIPGIDK